MADVETILKLVAEGRLTPEDADEILNALNAANEPEAAEPATAHTPPQQARMQDGPRHLRIQVTERGRPVSAYLPGLSDENADRIRSAINSGQRGPIIDIGDGDDRVLITSE